MQTDRRRFVAGALAAAALPAAAAAQERLITKPIPSSGEQLPVIGIGTARRYEAAPSEAEKAPLRGTLKRFHELGGKVIDTAPSYGQAESVVGDLVSELKIRPGLFLATKVGADSPEAGRAQIEASFQKLRTERIDLIAVHNLRDITNQLATLRGMKQAGRIRYVGATTSSDNQYADFEARMRRETLDVVQVDYALDNRGSADRILPLARDRGMAVWVNLPFGRGRLFQATQGKPLPDWAKEIDCTTWAQVFLKYVVSHPAVTCAVPGMAQAKYVDDNLGAARGRLPDAALRKRMEQFIDGV
ncbi:aldo/keto reductase [Phenylobacterium sp.]|jgi:aryl-alcohol dehydrogenase-like predicted oxidoreductase|uniref:aldo/keto reductase n=1 Tax=Phenylobacterium sp. TaxID=1871053 RepID=UPI002F91C066